MHRDQLCGYTEWPCWFTRIVKGTHYVLKNNSPRIYPHVYLTSCTSFFLPGLPLPFLHTASDQKLELGTAWEQGFPNPSGEELGVWGITLLVKVPSAQEYHLARMQPLLILAKFVSDFQHDSSFYCTADRWYCFSLPPAATQDAPRLVKSGLVPTPHPVRRGSSDIWLIPSLLYT